MKKLYQLLAFFLFMCVGRVIAQPASVYWTLEASNATYSVFQGNQSYYQITPGFAYYNWTVTPEMTILSGQGTPVIYVKFNHTTNQNGTISVDFGCNSSSACLTHLAITIVEKFRVPDNGGGPGDPPVADSFNLTMDPNIPYTPSLCTDAVTNIHMNQTAGSGTPTTYDWSYTVGTSSPMNFSPVITSAIQPLSFGTAGTYTVTCVPVYSGVPDPTKAVSFPIVVADCNPPNGKTPSSVLAFPNPTNDILTVTSGTQSTSSNKAGISKAFSYKIYNEKGQLVKSGKSSGVDVKVDTRDLPSKTYILNIFIGDQVIKKQIIVHHN